MSDTPSDNRSHEDTTPDNSDGTLGGYLAVHSRPPAYEGTDGHPYTVSIELEHTGNLRAPYSGYLVFPRWAETGVGIVGHVETDTVIEARTETEAKAALEALTLYRVQELLEEALQRRRKAGPEPPDPSERS